jgi:membrane-associated phospholipid phosphatase
MLTNHRRAFRFSFGLLVSVLFLLVAVGRHAEHLAPVTNLVFIGEFDGMVQRWTDDIRNGVFTAICTFLSVIGGGLVTIPLRFAVAAWLLFRRRFVAFSAFVLAWVASEALLTWLKIFFHRGRPPEPLVTVNGFSFPSGHAVAGAALAVALVLVAFPPGPERRKWERVAMGFTFVMALSRVYLSAHWFSDVVTGVVLGAGIAIGAAALVTEVTNALSARGVIKRPETPPGDPLDPRLE